MTQQPIDIDFNELSKLERELKAWEDKINSNPNASELDIQKMLKEMEDANILLEGLADRVDTFNDKLDSILSEMDNAKEEDKAAEESKVITEESKEDEKK
jgi:tRNA(Ile)-lysidine synthase TilS/MesJ